MTNAINSHMDGRVPRMRGPVRAAGILVSLGLVGFTVGLAGSQADAGSATSTTGYFSTAYSGWANSANISTSTKSAKAYSNINISPASKNAPTGYMGARGRLFIGGSTTNMSCEGTTVYNTVPQMSVVAASCTRTTSGTWNSYGVTYGYGNGGYSAVYTYNSPIQPS